MDAAVLYARKGDIGWVTLNRPDNRNSMTPELLDAFEVAIGRAKQDRDIRAVVITGTGASFSAGADFRTAIQRDGEGDDFRLPHEKSFAMYTPFLSVLDLEVPVIAAMNGHAIGGGFGLSLACDLRIACTTAKYGANFCRLGLSPGMAITYLLPRLVGVARANELLFTGRLFDGAEAVRMGYASQAMAAEEVLPAAQVLAEEIAKSAPIAVRATKRDLYMGLGWDPRSHARREAFDQAESLQTEDAKEGVAALLAKRAPIFRGR